MLGQGILVKLGLLGFQTLLSIFSAEKKHGEGAGSVKKVEVMRTVEDQAKNLNVEPEGSDCGVEDLIVIIGDLVDNVVKLFNCVGLFSKRK